MTPQRPKSKPAQPRQPRLQAKSLKEITIPWKSAVNGLALLPYFDDRPGRSIEPGPFLNALVKWWTELPAPQREAIALEAMKAYDGLRARLSLPLDEGDEEAEVEDEGSFTPSVEAPRPAPKRPPPKRRAR